MILTLILVTILTPIAPSTSVNVACSSGTYTYNIPSPVSCCEIKGNLSTTREYEQLTISNNLKSYKGFIAENKSIAYLPIGIEKCCEVVEVLMIKNSGLKDITTINLQSFPDVIVLDLSFNRIRIIEVDLFQSNSKIKFLYLNGNQISAISPTAFNKLNQYSHLFMKGNECYIKTEKKLTSQFLNKLKDILDCTKDENLTKVRHLVRMDKMEADLKYLRGFVMNMVVTSNLQSKLNSLENQFENHSSAIEILSNISVSINVTTSEEFKKISNKIEAFKQANDIRINIFMYIISIFLILVVLSQIFIIFRNKKQSKESSNALDVPQSEPNDPTNITQLDDDDTPVESLQRDYASHEAYQYFNPSELQHHNKSHDKHYKQEYSNDIYGTSMVEELYSESISPYKIKNDDHVEEGSSIYAVVFKPNNQ